MGNGQWLGRVRVVGGIGAIAAMLAVVMATVPQERAAAAPDAAAFQGSPAGPVGVVFAPGTADEFAAEMIEELSARGTEGPQAAQFSFHWNANATALNNGGSGQGDSLELTWSILPDGTTMPGQFPEDTTCTSNLIATFDALYGAGVWQSEIQLVWDDWTALTGNVYTPAVALDANGTPVDDGAPWPTSGGLAGVRGDIRIGGCAIDGAGSGNGSILGYNFFPSNGDMKIESTDAFYAGNPITPNFHNVFSNEHGHGAGLGHMCPTNNTKLMEPLINTAFTGLQHDDIRGVQRAYGDRFEVINNPNDAQGAATVLTPAGGQTETQLSLDSTSDQDWFQFTANGGDSLAVSVTPNGFTYPEGPDPMSDLCASASPTSLNSLALMDLQFEIRDASGVLVSANFNGPGVAEAVMGVVLPSTGTYYVRVTGAGTDDTQLYDLEVNVIPGIPMCDGQLVTVNLNDAVPAPYTAGADVVLGTPGPDVIAPGAGDDIVCGEGGNDTIFGGDGDDRLFGSAGDDTIYGGNGADTVDGDVGMDTLQGNAGADTVTGGDDNDVLSGNADNDNLTGGDGDDTIYGGTGNDTIEGEAGVDTVLGGAGMDTIGGGAGNDIISGNQDNDTLNGDAGNDTLYGVDGDDTINGGPGMDSALGGVGNDTISGGDDGDQLSGNEGNDMISGGDGDDDIYGVDGDDVIAGDAGADTVLGGDGADTITGGTGDDALSGNSGNDEISGGAGADELFGVNGSDTLTGGSGADIMLGGWGDDVLNSAGDGSVDQVSGNGHGLGDTCNADTGPLITDNVFLCDP